jgi:hypothetical protein
MQKYLHDAASVDFGRCYPVRPAMRAEVAANGPGAAVVAVIDQDVPLRTTEAVLVLS